MILINEENPEYIFANVTKMYEKNELLLDFMKKNPFVLDEIRKVVGEDLLEYIDAIHSTASVCEVLLKEKGLSDNILEALLKTSFIRPNNYFSNPIPNSKHPVDVMGSINPAVNIRESYEVFLKGIPANASDEKRNKLIANWFDDQCQTVCIRLNVKGMLMKMPKKGKNKGNLTTTITLARHTKGQKERSFDINMAYEKNDKEFGENGIVNRIIVWFRIKVKDFWRYKVVSFPTSAFLWSPEKFKQYGEQKQYKWSGHTTCSDLIINTGASYQLSCTIKNLNRFIKEVSGELIYDSVTCNL
jgi:hypothetical protein